MLSYRDFSAKPFNTVTAAAVALAKACTDAHVRLAMVISDSGAAAQLVTKYRCERVAAWATQLFAHLLTQAHKQPSEGGCSSHSTLH